MDPSINLKEVLVIDLKQSDSPEEQELAAKAEELVRGIVSKLKPILKYVTAPLIVHAGCTQGRFFYGDKEYRALYLCATKKRAKFETENSGRALLLHEDGCFFVVFGNFTLRNDEDHGSTWQYFPFGEVLESLRTALKTAEEKREKHLASIRDAREMLDKAIAAISQAS